MNNAKLPRQSVPPIPLFLWGVLMLIRFYSEMAGYKRHEIFCRYQVIFEIS